MKHLNVLMVGVDNTSSGGMLSVANCFRNSEEYNNAVNLIYLGTATRKGKIAKVFHFIFILPKLLWILSTKKIDILHVHMAEKTSVYRKGIVMYLAKMFDCRIICQMHAGPFIKWYQTLPKNKKAVVSRIINLPDKMLVLGYYWLNEMSDLIPIDKLDVLYNGVPIPTNNDYDPYNAKDISFFGHLRKEKGIYELLKAASLLKGRLPKKTTIHLCGTCDQFDIQKYIEDNDLEELVVFHGWVNGKDKEIIEKKTAVSVLPTYIEGLSMTVLECMTLGIPVLTTNITTMPEMLDGIVDMVEPGDYKNLADKLLELINNPELRLEISKKEFERVSNKFSINKMIHQTLLIYDELRKERK